MDMDNRVVRVRRWVGGGGRGYGGINGKEKSTIKNAVIKNKHKHIFQN